MMMKADTDGVVKPLHRWAVREEPVSQCCRGWWEFLGGDESQSETQVQLQMSFQTTEPNLDHWVYLSPEDFHKAITETVGKTHTAPNPNNTRGMKREKLSSQLAMKLNDLFESPRISTSVPAQGCNKIHIYMLSGYDLQADGSVCVCESACMLIKRLFKWFAVWVNSRLCICAG